jgi:hypothetical protein
MRLTVHILFWRKEDKKKTRIISIGLSNRNMESPNNVTGDVSSQNAHLVNQN